MGDAAQLGCKACRHCTTMQVTSRAPSRTIGAMNALRRIRISATRIAVAAAAVVAVVAAAAEFIGWLLSP